MENKKLTNYMYTTKNNKTQGTEQGKAVKDVYIKDVYIIGGLRTNIGQVQGQFKTVRPDAMGAAVINGLMEKYRLPFVDEVICGNAVGPGGNIARLMTLQTVLPKHTPALTVDMQCASAGAALEIAFAKLQAGMGTTILAGGAESSSLQPIRRYAEGDTRQGEYMVAQFSPEENDAQVMLKGAERVAQKYNVTKAELDCWTLESHKRAAEAARSGVLHDVILSYDGCSVDESIRASMNQRLLDRMPSFFGKEGLTNAGNACFTHDGAAFLALTSSRELAEKNSYNADTDSVADSVNDGSHHAHSVFRIVACQSWGGEPLNSPEGAWKVSELLLKKVHLSMDDMDAIEWNEAFGVIDVLFERNYPNLVNTYNPMGGALAYGHPYGASGAIILIHLLKDLELCRGRYGLFAIAGAGGLGTAMLVERIEV